MAGCVGCLVWFALIDHSRLGSPLAFVLLAAVLGASVLTSQWDGSVVVSGSFVASMMSVAFLGPAAAFAIETIVELATRGLVRYRASAVAINVMGVGLPLLLTASIFESLAPHGGAFYAVLALLAALYLALNALLITVLMAWLDDEAAWPRIRHHVRLVPALLINVGLAVAAAGIYASIGLGGVTFVLLSIVAFTYMARLVVTARERTRQYAGLSWGVLAGLIRTLDLRDSRAARHAAAVAAFSRDIAQAVGMSARDCELAHTAGLLHDIGRFGLSDRVMERGRTLTEQDWVTIRRHPEMGADLLRDLGVYGPVAEIVRAHHERVDGRGYPDGLSGDDIPDIAKIVAVAEVYDTLTADDTYRTPVSSFEALTELRRVAGSQLDARCVEALAELLAGRSVEYRHADFADFDKELDVERRIGEAVGVAQSAAVDQAGGR